MKYLILLLTTLFFSCSNEVATIEHDAINYEVVTYTQGGEGLRCVQMPKDYCDANPEESCCTITAIQEGDDFTTEQVNGGIMLHFKTSSDVVSLVEIIGFYKGDVFIVYTIKNPINGAQYSYFDNLKWID